MSISYSGQSKCSVAPTTTWAVQYVLEDAFQCRALLSETLAEPVVVQ